MGLTRERYPALSTKHSALRNPVEILRLGDVGNAADALQRFAREGRVDIDLHEGVLAALFARAGQGSDVDPFVSDDLRDLGDHPRAVAIEEQQRRRVALETSGEAVDLEDIDD